jgi:pimeloyl-ACP methyl ester carboxylesterase
MGAALTAAMEQRRRKWGATLLVLGCVSLAAFGHRLWGTHPVIDESEYVSIGGIEQFVRMSGQDRANPVLLFLHGGPGVSMMGLSRNFQPWEKYFIVVQWDQRGTGRTYARNAAAPNSPLTIDRMARDGVELAQFLQQHFHKKKIIIVGHSWGSILGVQMAQSRPDLFSAYVGTGQFVDKKLAQQISYEDLQSRARMAHDTQTLDALRRLAGASLEERQAFVARTWSQTYAPAAERELKANLNWMTLDLASASLADIRAFRLATRHSVQQLSPVMAYYDIHSAGLDFAIPFFVIQGDDDSQTPAVLARNYFDAVRAPQGRYISLHGGGHFAVITMSSGFLQALVDYVRPLALAAG